MKATRLAPLWFAIALLIFGLVRLGLTSTFIAFITRDRNWELTAYLLTADLLTASFAIVVVGILLMVAARWANTIVTAVCIVAVLHDGVWLMLWYFIHSQAPAELVVFVFGPMVVSAIACATVLAIQIWRHTADFRAGLGQRRPSAAFGA